MKRWVTFSGVMLLGVASVVVSEIQKVDVPASPAGLLYLVADSEQELTRMPVSFMRISDEEEIRLGNELARFYADGEGQRDGQEATTVEGYLAQVGSQVAGDAHRRLPYRFHYIPGAYLVNAFALPGGHVYVGGGLLELMDSEDELAAVIGHEIEHIDHYHCADRVQRQQALRKIPLGGLVDLPIQVFEAGYRKDQELEADREGTRLAVQAGYAASGAIRMFEAFGRLYEEYHSTVKTPQEELSRVARQTLEGYFRSHPLPSERIAQIQRLIASEGWTMRPERDLAVSYIFWTARARRALDAKRYGQAEQLANQSVKPDQLKAFQVLALAQFAEANFSGAAAAYRKTLEIDPIAHPEVVAAYAQALAAEDRTAALAEFERWVERVKGEKPLGVDVAAAGLQLLAGHAEPARQMEIELRQNRDVQTPVSLGELGWWYYLDGNYAEAAGLLSRALQQRPGDAKLALHLAWALIEILRYGDALQALGGVSHGQGIRPEAAIARAVARWQAQEHDPALLDFGAALAEQPEWGNSSWVKALYSPLVAQSIQQMQAERARREQKTRVVANR